MNRTATRWPLRVALSLAAALTVAACGQGEQPPSGNSSTPSAGAGTGPITVLAAASLKESFTTLGTQFSAAHPGAKVTFSFGPSSGLAQQVTAGAPVDVFAAANTATMASARASGRLGAPASFATNSLTIVTPPANPGTITALSDLARPGVTVALCQRQVPCGTAAATVLTRARLNLTPVTQEVDVKAVLTKVRLGEVDAGLVYRTDAKAAGAAVHEVALPAEQNLSTTYPIAVATDSAHATTAKAFVAYVRSAEGQQVLTAAGFAPAA